MVPTCAVLRRNVAVRQRWNADPATHSRRVDHAGMVEADAADPAGEGRRIRLHRLGEASPCNRIDDWNRSSPRRDVAISADLTGWRVWCTVRKLSAEIRLRVVELDRLSIEPPVDVALVVRAMEVDCGPCLWIETLGRRIRAGRWRRRA